MIRAEVYPRILAELELLRAPPNLLGIQTISDEFKVWTEVPAEQQPALFLVPETENTGPYKHGVPEVWTINATLWVYVRKQNDVAGVRELWPILDAIDRLAQPKGPPQFYANTLGGSVVRFSLSGTTEISGGYLGDQTVAAVPIVVIVA